VTKQFWKQFGSLKLENGVLYKEWFDWTGVREGWRLIVPLGLRDQFVKIAHGDSTGGHLSVEKSIDQVRKRAYWPDLVNDVNRIIRSCPHVITGAPHLEMVLYKYFLWANHGKEFQ